MNRAEEVQNRIANIQQIKGVVIAMRGLAAAHVRDANRHLEAIRAYEATIGEAIAEALFSFPAPETGFHSHDAQSRLTVIVGAEQGFSGAYNEQILERALADDPLSPPQDFIVIGQRCISDFPTNRKAPLWTCHMAALTDEVPAVASRIVDAIFERVETGAFKEVYIVSAQPSSRSYVLNRNRIVPFDFTRFTKPVQARAPLVLVPPRDLIENLVEEYVFSEICEALMLGFAAENDARMQAMTRARKNVERTNAELTRQFHQLRQEQTTNEIIELSSSSQPV